MKKWIREVIYGVVILIFCIASYIYAGAFTQFAVTIPLARPEAYLRMWLIAFAFLAVLKIITSYRNRSDEIAKPIFTKMPVLITLIFAAYLYVMPLFGFFLATFLFMSMSVIVINFNIGKEIPWGKPFSKEIVKCLVFSLMTTVITEQIFRNILAVRLPVSRLF